MTAGVRVPVGHMETREQLLENALKKALRALATYGPHPIIERQAEKAISGKTEAPHTFYGYTDEEIAEL
jgi:hypothetical protein